MIEVVIVISILGVLAAVAMPHFECVNETARASAIKGQLGVMRSALSIQYAKASMTTGTAAFPALTGAIFSDGLVPLEPADRVRTVKTTPGVNNAGGWQYHQATGIVKCNVYAYSSY